MENNENSSKGYALITGATSGFGYEFARLFAQEGYHLILVARSLERLESVSAELASQYGVTVKIIAEDLFRPEAARSIYEQTKAWAVNVLVNDAGQGEYGNFIDYDLARDIDLIQLNVTS